jgi:hypothetical protein
MTSVGVMASAVVVSSGVDVLLENFTSVAEWGAGITSVAGGRTGNAGQISGTTEALYTIPAANESDVLTVGFAYRISSLSASRPFLILRSDTAAVAHDTIRVTTAGAIEALLGGTTGGIIGSSATGLIAINTWYYIECQVTLHDTAGAVTVRRNGSNVLSLSGVDTKLAGTKTVFDTIGLRSSSSTTSLFDDLYITTGSGGTFKGDITIP